MKAILKNFVENLKKPDSFTVEFTINSDIRKAISSNFFLLIKSLLKATQQGGLLYLKPEKRFFYKKLVQEAQ